MSKVYDWFEERLEIQSIADDITSKYVPPHVNIFYCLGGITLTCFIVQVATGFAMTFYYRPTVTEAFASVQYIMTDVNFGWLIRSIHRWSASMMVLMMILHVCRVYLTGGFKKPRELTWVTGVILSVCTVSFGVRSIDKDEFHAMFRNLCKQAKIKCPSATIIDKIFAVGDPSGDGEIDWDEWVSLYAKVKLGEVDGLGDILQSSNLVLLQKVPMVPGKGSPQIRAASITLHQEDLRLAGR